MAQPRPTYTGLPATVNYGATFTLTVSLPSSATSVTGKFRVPVFYPVTAPARATSPVSLIDLGFATHAVHMDQRLVQLVSTLSADKKTLTVTGPPSSNHYPPGPAFLYVVTNAGVPSFGHKTIIGTGASPPVDEAAIAKSVQVCLSSGFMLTLSTQ